MVLSILRICFRHYRRNVDLEISFFNTIWAFDDIANNLKTDPFYTEIKGQKKAFDLSAVSKNYHIENDIVVVAKKWGILFQFCDCLRVPRNRLTTVGSPSPVTLQNLKRSRDPFAGEAHSEALCLDEF